MSEKAGEAFLDITDVVCPMTFVKVKIAMEDLAADDILRIRMNEGEPVRNVPRSLKEEGHRVIELSRAADGTYIVVVKKNGL